MMKKSPASRFLTSGYLILIVAFMYLPIVYLIVFSFNDSKSMIKLTGFSLKWYENMFRDRELMQSLYYTILVAVVSTVVSTVVGTVTAIGLSKSKRVFRETVLEVNNLPVLNPDIVTAIGLMLLFISIKVQLSLTTLILAHISFCIPYVILSVMPKLRQLDDNVAEAALDLGATPFQALWKVIIPQIYPAILSGALIAFSMSFDDFVISYFTNGPGVSNISIFVYTMKRFNPSVNALSAIIVAAVTLILVLVNIISYRKGKENVKEAIE